MRFTIWCSVTCKSQSPEYTADVDGLGTLRLLEAIRFLGLRKNKILSSLNVRTIRLGARYTTERNNSDPRSPYAVANILVLICVNYREVWGMLAATEYYLIMRAHGEENIRNTKITRGMANIALGLETAIHMGNIDSLRDWGHAKDYKNAVDDASTRCAKRLFIATGKQYSVREFIIWTANALGIDLEFRVGI